MAGAEVNPYGFDDDIDSDLWGNPGVKGSDGHPSFVDHAEGAKFHMATDNGEECPSCGEVHELPRGLAAMPRQLHGLTATLLKNFEYGNVATVNSAKTPSGLRLMSAIVGFARSTRDSGANAPLIRALSEVMDTAASKPIVDGQVSTLTKYYRAERTLLLDHLILKTVNDFVQRLIADNKTSTAEEQSFLAVAQHMLSYYQALVARSVERYRLACVEQGHDQDEELVTNGHFKKGSADAKAARLYLSQFISDDDDDGT